MLGYGLIRGSKFGLEAMLNRRADVLTVRGISPYLRDRILAERFGCNQGPRPVRGACLPIERSA